MSAAPLPPLEVATASGRYPILVGAGLLDAASTWEGLPAARCALVVSDGNVAPRYLPRIVERLRARHPKLATLVLPAGEEHKHQGSLDRILDALFDAGADRSSLVYALGGGVVGDLAGFAAACFMRGIRFVQVPTTLLAQVDSSVGGKTGINHRAGKNMVGAFHQPQRVVCDLDVLKTLPPREFAAGLAEVIKYGPIADGAFLDWIEAHLDALVAREPDALAHAVRRSCAIKAEVVGADEREESGRRAILNFGHTFGHAIEAGLGYGEWLHGEAVGCGLVMATDLSVRLGRAPAGLLPRVVHVVERAGLPVRAPALGEERFVALMRGDKKAVGGEMRFVLLRGIGQAEQAPAPEALVRDVIRAHGGA
jgi:3-dehydroquinate synthase